jgi:hypothetical protein
VDDFGVDSKDLSDFFTAISVGKQKRKKELDEAVGDAVDDFFSTISTGKKVIKEKKETLVGNSFDELFLSPLKEEIAPKKKKKIQEQKTVKAFENWLYSETPKKQEQVIEEVIENSLDEVLEDLEEYKEELEGPKEELIEKSLGLLAEPSDVKQQNDPLTPINQNFATLDDLQKHYKLFLSRIQQQLSTLGGGGETQLRYLDDIVGIATNSSAYNRKYLQWNSATNRAEFTDPSDSENTTIVSVTGITTYYAASNTDDYIGVSADVPVTILLPISPIIGKKITVKDEGNKISTYNITVTVGAGVSVENDTSVVMKINHQSFTYFYNGSNWFLV